MPYDLTTMDSIYHNQDEIIEISVNNSPVYNKDYVYYIKPTSSALIIAPAQSYNTCNNSRVKYTFVPGDATPYFWIGNMGKSIIPSSDPSTTVDQLRDVDDTLDFRILYPGFGPLVDVHDQRETINTAIEYGTPKITVEMWDFGITIWDSNGDLIETHTWTPTGTWTGAPIYVTPCRVDGTQTGLQYFDDMRLYSLSITDDVLGTIYNGAVDANGLYDSVSNSYTSTPGWTVAQEQ